MDAKHHHHNQREKNMTNAHTHILNFFFFPCLQLYSSMNVPCEFFSENEQKKFSRKKLYEKHHHHRQHHTFTIVSIISKWMQNPIVPSLCKEKENKKMSIFRVRCVCLFVHRFWVFWVRIFFLANDENDCHSFHFIFVVVVVVDINDCHIENE